MAASIRYFAPAEARALFCPWLEEVGPSVSGQLSRSRVGKGSKMQLSRQRNSVAKQAGARLRQLSFRDRILGGPSLGPQLERCIDPGVLIRRHAARPAKWLSLSV